MLLSMLPGSGLIKVDGLVRRVSPYFRCKLKVPKAKALALRGIFETNRNIN